MPTGTYPQQDPAFTAYINLVGLTTANQDNFQKDYMGLYDNELEFAKALVADCYTLTWPLAVYFDYQSFAKDLFDEEYTIVNGHVFVDR